MKRHLNVILLLIPIQYFSIMSFELIVDHSRDTLVISSILSQTIFHQTINFRSSSMSEVLCPSPKMSFSLIVVLSVIGWSFLRHFLPFRADTNSFAFFPDDTETFLWNPFVTFIFCHISLPDSSLDLVR